MYYVTVSKCMYRIYVFKDIMEYYATVKKNLAALCISPSKFKTLLSEICKIFNIVNYLLDNNKEERDTWVARLVKYLL